MDSKIHVLIFPAGEINSIELHDALSTCVNIQVYGASSVDRHGAYVFKNYSCGLPKIHEPNFLTRFNNFLIENHIDVVIPTHDDVALYMAEVRNEIKAIVLTADTETNLICRDKKETYTTFKNYDFCPKVYETIEAFPVFIKPRKGQGSVGAKKIEIESDLPSDIALSEYVICEYLSGKELSVDCFTDKDGNLQVVLPRLRQRTFGGVSVRAKKEILTDEIMGIAASINEKLNFLGLWYFQIKQDSYGRYKLMEISTRCAGTMCVSRALGINLPLLSVYAALGRKTEVLLNQYMLEVDRTLISRYKTDIKYQKVYIDLDDTILINNKVNLQMIRFLYQCVNDGKQIILLTRHAADHENSVEEILQKNRISLKLFNEIIELDFNTSKASVIEPSDAIFIDNSFAEREVVYKKWNIPVFDVDTVEVLLDWRL